MEIQIHRLSEPQLSQAHMYCLLSQQKQMAHNISQIPLIKELVLPPGPYSPAREPRTLLPSSLTSSRRSLPEATGQPASSRRDCTGTLRQQRQPLLDLISGPTLPSCSRWPAHQCPVSYRFSSNSIGDGGAKALAEALKVNQGLESLE